MRVQFGNVVPHSLPGGSQILLPGAPAITYVEIPDGEHVDENGDPNGVALYGVQPDADLDAIKAHIEQRAFTPSGIMQLPGHEALLAVAHSTAGLWAQHSPVRPSWVWSDDDVFGDQLAAYFGIERIGDEDLYGPVEETHWSHIGPPGVVPNAISPELTSTNATHDQIWRALFGGSVGTSGTSTAAAAGSLTDSGASWGTTQFINAIVVVGAVYGIVKTHTGTVLTIDRWYNWATPGGAAGSTPGATSAYEILPTTGPACFMGLTADAGAVAAGDTTLPSEITTAGGGLVRKIATLAHTAAATTGTLTDVFTANGTDSLPVTVAKEGVSNSITSGVTNLYQTLVSPTATMAASGDQLTLTDTVSSLG